MYNTITEIKNASKENGGFFFDKGTMKFFNSRIGKKVYYGKYFITSERYDDSCPRKYTVRICNDDGSIDSVSTFQQFSSIKEAEKWMTAHAYDRPALEFGPPSPVI
jgi:hypothetical protein